jgi:hypothetical protein
MHRGLMDRVLVAVAGVAIIAGVHLGGSAKAAPSALPGGWRVVPSPALAGGELIGVSALSSTDAWAVGSRAVGGVFSTLAEHWDGTRWQEVPISGPGNFNELRAVAIVTSSDAWAVGVTSQWGALIEHWNGSSWQQVESPVSGAQTPLYGIKAFAANDVWAVGEEGPRGLVLHFDGSRWSRVTVPEPPGAELTLFGDVDGLAGSDVWIAGESYTDTQEPLVEHFDGSTWTIVPSPPSGGDDSYLRGLDVRTDGDVWMVGDSIGPPPEYVEEPLIQHLGGASWTAYDGKPGEPWAVAAMSPNDVWVVGNQVGARGDYEAMIEHWDGASWSLAPMLQSAGGDSELNDVTALANGMVWAVGSYSPRATDQPLIELNPTG